MKDLTTAIISPLKKKDIIARGAAAAEEIVQGGEVALLPLIVQASRAQTYLEAFIAGLKPGGLKEAQSYNDRNLAIQGAKIGITETGVSYDYSADAQWQELNAAVKAATEKRKEREEFLKALKGVMQVVNEDTGEVQEVRPPVKKSTTSISVTL